MLTPHISTSLTAVLTDSLQLRALYPDNQQFALNAFTISVSKTPSMEGGLMNLLGFRADILFGEQAPELGGEGFDSDVVDPYQAYLQVLGLRLETASIYLRAAS